MFLSAPAELQTLLGQVCANVPNGLQKLVLWLLALYPNQAPFTFIEKDVFCNLVPIASLVFLQYCPHSVGKYLF